MAAQTDIILGGEVAADGSVNADKQVGGLAVNKVGPGQYEVTGAVAELATNVSPAVFSIASSFPDSGGKQHVCRAVAVGENYKVEVTARDAGVLTDLPFSVIVRRYLPI